MSVTPASDTIAMSDGGAPQATSGTPLPELESMVKRSRDVRRAFEGTWYRNLAFYNSDQWLYWDGTRLFEPSMSPGELRLVDNQIKPAISTALAKMTKQHPVFVSTPGSSDDDDINAARMAEKVCDYQWTELDLTRKRRQAIMWSLVCGSGYLKVSWDRTVGAAAEVFVDGNNQPMVDGSGQLMRPDRPELQELLAGLPPETVSQMRKQRVAMGDIRVEVRTPFEILPDPLAGEEGLESAMWAIECAIRSPEWVKEHFGEEVEPDASDTAGIAESRMPSLTPGAARGSTGEQAKKGVRVWELWRKDSPSHPGGEHTVWVSGKVLQSAENPYGWLPYVMFRGVAAPGRFYPEGRVTDLVGPQIQWNTTISQIAENAQRIGNPPLASPEGTDFEWSGLPGEQLKYPPLGTPDAVPQFLQVPELPGYIREQIGRIKDSMREISGQHEVSSGSVPSGVTAASAINLLLEQDDTRLGPDIEDMEISLGHVGTRVLDLVARFYTDERMVRLAGEDDAWDMFTFKGAQLRGHTEIRVQAGSAMPRSKAAKQAAMQQMLDLVLRYAGPGSIDQRTLRKFFMEYEVGALERLFDDISQDERKVKRENRRLMMATEVPVNAWDNHAVEVSGHNEERKSAGYEKAVADNPQVALVFEAHVAQHMQALMPPPLPPTESAPGAPSPSPVNPGSPSPGGPLPVGSSPMGPVPSQPSS